MDETVLLKVTMYLNMVKFCKDINDIYSKHEHVDCDDVNPLECDRNQVVELDHIEVRLPGFGKNVTLGVFLFFTCY